MDKDLTGGIMENKFWDFILKYHGGEYPKFNESQLDAKLISWAMYLFSIGKIKHLSINIPRRRRKSYLVDCFIEFLSLEKNIVINRHSYCLEILRKHDSLINAKFDINILDDVNIKHTLGNGSPNNKITIIDDGNKGIASINDDRKRLRPIIHEAIKHSNIRLLNISTRHGFGDCHNIMEEESGRSDTLNLYSMRITEDNINSFVVTTLRAYMKDLLAPLCSINIPALNKEGQTTSFGKNIFTTKHYDMQKDRSPKNIFDMIYQQGIGE